MSYRWLFGAIAASLASIATAETRPPVDPSEHDATCAYIFGQLNLAAKQVAKDTNDEKSKEDAAQFMMKTGFFIGKLSTIRSDLDVRAMFERAQAKVKQNGYTEAMAKDCGDEIRAALAKLFPPKK